METVRNEGSPSAFVGLCSLDEARTLKVEQLSTSGCGVTALVNILMLSKAILEKSEIKDLQLGSCILRLRRNQSYLPDYLASRSVAGCTGADLVESMKSLIIDNPQLQSKLPGLTGQFVSYSEIISTAQSSGSKESIFEYIVESLKRDKFLIGTFNLQVEGNDAWHHQVIFGANVKQRCVYCFNPLCVYTEDEINSYVSTPSILLIRRNDVVSRLPPADIVVNESMYDTEEWKKFSVRENIETMKNDSSKKYLVIPANYVGGLAVFERGLATSSSSDDLDEAVPTTVFALFGGDSTEMQKRYTIPGTNNQQHIIIHTRRNKDRVYLNDKSDKLFVDDIWPGCKVMADYLSENVNIFRSKSVIELGAGAALPSLVCAKLGAKYVCATDYPEQSVLTNIQILCQENGIGAKLLAENDGPNATSDDSAFDIAGLEWGNCTQINRILARKAESSGFDVVLCAELLWKDTYPYHKPLLDSIASLLAPVTGRAYVSFAHRPTISTTEESQHTPANDMELFALAAAEPYNMRVTYLFSSIMYRDVGEESPAEVHFYCLHY
jgi:nicotinamide N-methyltransferase